MTATQLTQTEAEDMRAQRRRLQTVLVAALPVAFVLAMSWFGTYTFINAYFTRTLGKSNAEWTALTLWFNGTMMFWPLACVPLVSRFGHRRVMSAAIVSAGILYAVTGFAQTTVAMSVIVVLMAFVPSAISVAWTPVVVEAGGTRPGRAIATCILFNTVVGAAALASGGKLIAAAGCRATFLAIAAACVPCLAIFYGASRRLPTSPPVKRIALFCIPKDEYLRLARAPFLFLMLAGICMEPFSFHTANQLFPNLARDAHQLSEGTIGTIVALGRIPALLSLILLARIVDDVSVTAFYGAGLLLGGLCVAGLGSVPGTAALVALYCGYFMFQGTVWGTNVAAVNAAVGQEEREYAFAVMMSLSTGATFAVGIVHNRLLTAGLSLPAVMHFSGLMSAAAGALMIVYSFTRFASWGHPGRGERSC